MKKGLSIIINIVLFAIIVFLAWQVVKSIQAPIKFSKEKENREVQIIERLIDIRNAEVFYKNANSKYTDNFDSLIAFCQTAEIPIVKIVPDPTDTTFTRTINDTIGYLKVLDTIRKGNSIRISNLKKALNKSEEQSLTPAELEQLTVDINAIKWAPFSQPQQQFELEAGTIPRNGIDVPVFEARTPYDVYLATPGEAFTEKDWRQRVENAKEEKVKNARNPMTNEIDELSPFYRYPGLKVGSMNEASVDGNWDKL